MTADPIDAPEDQPDDDAAARHRNPPAYRGVGTARGMDGATEIPADAPRLQCDECGALVAVGDPGDMTGIPPLWCVCCGKQLEVVGDD